jgi:hypothetical protein
MESGTLDADYLTGDTAAVPTSEALKHKPEVPFPWSTIPRKSEFHNELYTAIDAAMEGRSELDPKSSDKSFWS